MIYVGTSGFSYKSWKGVFYPAQVPQKYWLEHYSKAFNVVEINNSFYRMPDKKTVAGWYDRTPDNFVFVMKGSRFITHIKRMKDCKDSIDVFLQHLMPLKSKFKCILWQLPPSFKIDSVRLKSFLRFLPAKPLSVFEFRHQSWYNPQIYKLLSSSGAGICVHDMPGKNPDKMLTLSGILYLRFHGPHGNYEGKYSFQKLAATAKQAVNTGSQDIYAFFNNDMYGYAVKNAGSFKKYLSN
jgi:uncharacterized protein YecE (DUF72 family)